MFFDARLFGNRREASEASRMVAAAEGDGEDDQQMDSATAGSSKDAEEFGRAETRW